MPSSRQRRERRGLMSDLRELALAGDCRATAKLQNIEVRRLEVKARRHQIARASRVVLRSVLGEIHRLPIVPECSDEASVLQNLPTLSLVRHQRCRTLNNWPTSARR